MEQPSIAYISTFPPSQCGIATYTTDLLFHFHRTYSHIKAIKAAILPEDEILRIDFEDNNNYKLRLTSDFDFMINELNHKKNLIINLQHEF